MVDFPNEIGLIGSREFSHAGVLGVSDHVTDPALRMTGCSEYRLDFGAFLSVQVTEPPLTTGASAPVQTTVTVPFGSIRVTT